MQKLAWERHGFRAANFAGTDSISRFGVAGTLDQIPVFVAAAAVHLFVHPRLPVEPAASVKFVSSEKTIGSP